jgi:hypothetical protein
LVASQQTHSDENWVLPQRAENKLLTQVMGVSLSVLAKLALSVTKF